MWVSFRNLTVIILLEPTLDSQKVVSCSTLVINFYNVTLVSTHQVISFLVFVITCHMIKGYHSFLIQLCMKKILKNSCQIHDLRSSHLTLPLMTPFTFYRWKSAKVASTCRISIGHGMASLAACLLAGLLVCVPLVHAAAQSAPCDKSRKVFTESWGIVTDGPTGFNYTQDSHCEWLIKGMKV